MSGKPQHSEKKRGLPLDSTPVSLLHASASGRPAKSNISPAIPKPVSEPHAQQAVASFSVQLGAGACPNPEDMVRLLNGAKLQHLKVTILTTSGPTACTREDQLKLCTSQVEVLLTAIQDSLESITQLGLAIENTPEPGSYDLAPPVSPAINPITIEVHIPVPEDIAAMANSVLAKLASTLPKLRSLHIWGCVSQKTLQALSPTFPQLTSVQVEALSVPIRASKFLLSRLPKLNHFAITSEKVNQSTDGQVLLQAYVSASFNALHTRSRLTRVDMALAFDTRLYILDDAWDVLPGSLRELQFTYRNGFHTLGHLDSLQKVQRLSLVDFPFSSLSELSTQFPNIERLTVTGSKEIVIECSYDNGINDIRNLQFVFDRGLKLVAHSLKLEGKGSFIRDLLAVIPALPGTTSLALSLQGKRPYPFCLEHVARAFPNLKRLTIMGEGAMCGSSDPMTDQAFAAPLLKCRSLERLQLSMLLDFTTESLRQLCLCLPHLSFLFYHPWTGVDDAKLKATVQAERGAFEFMPSSVHGFFANPDAVTSIYD